MTFSAKRETDLPQRTSFLIYTLFKELNVFGRLRRVSRTPCILVHIPIYTAEDRNRFKSSK